MTGQPPQAQPFLWGFAPPSPPCTAGQTMLLCFECAPATSGALLLLALVGGLYNA